MKPLISMGLRRFHHALAAVAAVAVLLPSLPAGGAQRSTLPKPASPAKQAPAAAPRSQPAADNSARSRSSHSRSSISSSQPAPARPPVAAQPRIQPRPKPQQATPPPASISRAAAPRPSITPAARPAPKPSSAISATQSKEAERRTYSARSSHTRTSFGSTTNPQPSPAAASVATRRPNAQETSNAERRESVQSSSRHRDRKPAYSGDRGGRGTASNVAQPTADPRRRPTVANTALVEDTPRPRAPHFSHTRTKLDPNAYRSNDREPADRRPDKPRDRDRDHDHVRDHDRDWDRDHQRDKYYHRRHARDYWLHHHHDFWRSTARIHVHGPSCGHYYYRSRWRAYPSHCYTRRHTDSFFFFVDLGSYRSRNVPVYVYEEQLQTYPTGDIFEASDPLSAAYATFSDGNYYQSLLHFDRAIAEDRDNGLLYLARAQARIAIGDYRLAYEDLIEGMDRVPEWADVDFNVAEIYSNVDDLHDQIDALETWTQRRPADHRAHFVLGYLQYFLANYDAAKDALILALAGEPDHEHARALLDRTLQAQALPDTPDETRESPPAAETPAVTVE